MRRSIAEWLLLPLFLLPLSAGAGFAVYARQGYFDAVGILESEGERIVLESLTEDMPGTVAEAPSIAPDALRHAHGRLVPFRLGGESGSVVLPGHGLPEGEWALAEEYPAGLSAEALADSAVRLDVERGTAPALAAEPDAGTRALGILRDDPDFEVLRTAPLPAMTKLFLVRRWRGEGFGEGNLDSAEQLLGALAEVQRGLLVREFPPAPGEHLFGTVKVVSAGVGRPFLVIPEGVAAGFEFTHNALVPGRAPATLKMHIPSGNEEPGAIWRGRLHGPVAGLWSLRLVHGADWWKASFFKEAALPVLGGILLFLVLPVTLWIELRRRRKLDEARARFITEIAHDLRTPLTSLRLYAEMLAEGRAPEEKAESYVLTMARESARVSGLLANLLDLSKLERGKRELQIETLELDEATEPALRDFVMLYPDRDEDLRIVGGDGILVRADRTALTRSLLNLLDNAGKFTEKGTPIKVSFERWDEGKVRILVADEGPGVTSAERSRLFDRYARGQGARRDGVPGTGLGLSLVRDLAKAMGGTARFLPSEKGAAVEIVLPGGEDD